MKKTVILISAFCCMLPLMAHSDGEQVLVFRNTGEVNLFYSDRLDSVVCSPIDADSVLHSEPVSQIFYARDTTMLIPLAEIDSVAFGERNVMEFKEDVKEIAEADLRWIIRTEGNSIYYRSDTPQDVLPAVGQKLFCGFGDAVRIELFPNGLAARVISINTSDGEIYATLEPLELDEIFSKLFYAGSVSEVQSLRVKHRADLNSDLDVQVNVPLGDLGEIGVNGKIGIHGEVVVRPLEQYYHADIDLDYGFGFNVSLTSDDSGEADYEDIIASKSIPIPNPILNNVSSMKYNCL